MSKRPGPRTWLASTTWGWALALIAAASLACSAERGPTVTALRSASTPMT